MPQKPTVLCPIDYSDHSRVALRYAALIADHFGARLLLVTVNDLLLVQAAAMAYDAEYLQLQSHQDLREFYRDTNLPSAAGADDVTYDVRTGKPAPEILKAAADGHADLIVIGTHGLSGARKAFFGATTERVLRETTVPVLVTRRDALMVASLPEAAGSVGRILVPVDFTPATAHQVAVANGLAVALGVPLILTHVIEPLALPMRWRTHVGRADHERRAPPLVGDVGELPQQQRGVAVVVAVPPRPPGRQHTRHGTHGLFARLAQRLQGRAAGGVDIKGDRNMAAAYGDAADHALRHDVLCSRRIDDGLKDLADGRFGDFSH